MPKASILIAPRIYARIFVPAVGLPSQRVAQQGQPDVFELDVRPHKLRLVSNNHNEADEAVLTFSYDEGGVDPRYARDCEVYIYLADGSSGPFTPSNANLRFVGIAKSVTREFSESEKVVTIEALDYTTLFLECKVSPQATVPLYTDTLRSAWNKICDGTGYWDLETKQIVSTVSNLKSDGSGGPTDTLQFIGDTGKQLADTPLGSVVPQRLAKLGKIQVPPGSDTWAIWKHCCESLGLITYIRGSQCFVTTATDFYTSADPPRFVYGMNVLKLHESRNYGQLSSKNVCVRAFNPIGASNGGGCTLESFYPPLGSPPAASKKRLGASAQKSPTSVKSPDYEIFDYQYPVANQAQLDAIAQRIWEERTRQEMSGELLTREFVVPTVHESTFDLLTLQAGDQLQVEIAQEALDYVQKQPTIAQRVNALTAKGYSSNMATFIASNLDSISKLPPQFMCHSVETEIESAGAEGGVKAEIKVNFRNRIDLNTGLDDTGAVTGQGGSVTGDTPPVRGSI